ncbi:ATP-binding protein [Brevundimonas sp.]|uniref:ATP-binding protein n=1 Tax=Brevundimonas sp. TaxID=1871086 RepID=UPI0028A220CC|nr:ATP-binding protein [Brevundimonas sp.]
MQDIDEGASEHRAPPSAASLIEAMRDIGYTLETALADIIDNAISAGASTVSISYDTSASEPWLAVIDDGAGMSRKDLLTALRPGSRSPTDSRDGNDLGRFGLGLKTASFSQARSLTVVTRSADVTSAARWDLDFVVERDDWVLQLPPSFDPETTPGVSGLGASGTAVIWQKLDRLADATSGASLTDHLLDRLDSARRHLELVFHRFLQGEPGLRKVRIRMNGRDLRPFDPFHLKSPATQRLPAESIQVAGQKVDIEGFILPHHNKVSAKDWEHYAGEGGYLKNQGFYVYRGGRLIIHGTWFRLARQSELTKLARVRIDMPNGLDAFWKIDVRKASAQPPYVVRERLRALINEIGGPSRRVYTSKGHVSATNSPATLWHRRANKGQVSYEINRDHPMLAHITEALPDGHASELEAFLKSVERAFPIDAIFSDAASDPKSVSSPGLPSEDLEAVIRLTTAALREMGITLDAILADLARLEPYRSSWAAAEPLIRKSFQDMDDKNV